MTHRPTGASDEIPTGAAPVEVRLDPGSVETIARRVAELLNRQEQRPQTGSERRLLSAAEVARWWGVDRAWVYAHADRLGARRLGAGPRPRLRFDPDEVAERLAAWDPMSAPHRRASPPTGGDPPAARFAGRAELSSRRKQSDRPGGAPTPPATAPKTGPSAR